MAQLEDLAQARRLEHYRSRQEAAKGFDDDLEFCPSLSAEELAEIRRQVSQLVSQGCMKTSITPPQPKHVIPIIDPTNKTPLNINPVKSTVTTPSTVASVLASPFFTRPGSPLSYNGYSPTLAYHSLAASGEMTITPKVTKSIPIVDPNSGNIVNMPSNGGSNNNSGNGSAFGGFYSDISVR